MSSLAVYVVISLESIHFYPFKLCDQKKGFEIHKFESFMGYMYASKTSNRQARFDSESTGFG